MILRVEKLGSLYRNGRMTLWVSKMMPKSKSYTPKDVIAIDINEKKIVYGNDTINMEVNTGIDRAYRYKVLVESLQKKYS